MNDEVGIIKVTATGRINNDIAIVTDSNIRLILYYLYFLDLLHLIGR